MEDITKEFRSQIPWIIQEYLDLRYALTGESNFMNTKITVFNSLEDLTKNYDKVGFSYVFVPAIKYRDPTIAYEELTGERIMNRNNRDFILQDRIGGEWWGAKDKTEWYKRRINNALSDHTILEMIFGEVWGGSRKVIDVHGYKGMIKKPDRKTQKTYNTLPEFFSPAFNEL